MHESLPSQNILENFEHNRKLNLSYELFFLFIFLKYLISTYYEVFEIIKSCYQLYT